MKAKIICLKHAHFVTLILKKMVGNPPSSIRYLNQEKWYSVRNVWKIYAVSVVKISHTCKDSRIKKWLFVTHVMITAKILTIK